MRFRRDGHKVLLPTTCQRAVPAIRTEKAEWCPPTPNLDAQPRGAHGEDRNRNRLKNRSLPIFRPTAQAAPDRHQYTGKSRYSAEYAVEKSTAMQRSGGPENVAPEQRCRSGASSGQSGQTGDHLFLVTTTSRYSLGMTSVPSLAMLNLPSRALMSVSSAAPAVASSASNALTTGP
jgi:hypothetical protein